MESTDLPIRERHRKPHPIRSVLTTGQVAKICQVAPRTVSKWFDSGKLGGFRIPGCTDRRIPCHAAIRFLRENGMTDAASALERHLGWRIVLVSSSQRLGAELTELLAGWCDVSTAEDAFATGTLIADQPLALAVVDAHIGRGEALTVVRHLSPRTARRIVLASEDDTSYGDFTQAGAQDIFQHPFDVDLLARHIRRWINPLSSPWTAADRTA